MDRRRFVRLAAAGVLPLALPAAAPGAVPGRRYASAQERFPVDASEAWGRLYRVADRAWALVSDPMTDRTTLCNGGIVAGRNGVVLLDAYGSDEGARWMVEQARRLAGRPPTHIVLSHHHADHTRGLRGAVAASDPVVLTTEATWARVTEREPELADAVGSLVQPLAGPRPTELDLGDRSLALVPRRGHTESDITAEVFDASVAFCGDLVWNGMFPNYVDAIPSRLSLTVRVLRARGYETYVSGHGQLATADEMDRYIELLDHVEAAARSALERGISAEEAGSEYRLPEGFDDWVLFSPGYFEQAIGAWMRELVA